MIPPLPRLLPACLTLVLMSLPDPSFAQEKAKKPTSAYPAGVEEIRYPCPADGSEQPALFWKPDLAEGKTAPLLVAMHTWSGNYRQAGGEVKYAAWCLANDWIFIHPNFRGPNRTPGAMGSDLVIADVRAAIAWAKENADVDESRIYAIGVSGGGHVTQLLAGRMPDVWAGISSWCGISDIAAWHAETTEAGRDKYARDIEGALGGPPDTPERIADARHRSPLAWLENAAGVPLDLNHGVTDGRSGSVPFTHSLLAWNAIVPEGERLDEETIAGFYETSQPPKSDSELADPLYGRRQPLYRRAHGNTRLTIFDGGHEIVHEAALNWLAAQRKGEPVNWNPPKSASLDSTDSDTQSGK